MVFGRLAVGCPSIQPLCKSVCFCAVVHGFFMLFAAFVCQYLLPALWKAAKKTNDLRVSVCDNFHLPNQNNRLDEGSQM